MGGECSMLKNLEGEEMTRKKPDPTHREMCDCKT
jgi:hypothetical protein